MKNSCSYSRKSKQLLIVLFSSWLLGCGAAPIPEKSKTDYDVIVVGAGMGGLSAAAHLANAGLKVLVLEQHSKVGGCTTSFSRGEFNFDTALHELSLGGGDGIVKQLLQKAGVLEKIKLIRIPTIGRSFYPGVEFVHVNGLEETIQSLSQKWPAEKENIKNFYALMAKMNEEVVELRDLFLANPLAAFFTKLTIPFRQKTLSKYRNATIKDVLDEFFTDESLKNVISQFWMYQGPPPSEQWALIFMVAHYTYLKNGAWQIEGSSQALSDAFRDRIVALGGTVKTNTLVTSIEINGYHRVSGVETARGERYTSRYVVSNADPFQTFFKLVGEDKTPKKLAKKIRSMEPSNSLAGVYLGLDVDHTYFGVEDYEIIYNTSSDNDAMYENMMKGNYEKGLITITLPSVLNDPFYAPKGKSSVIITTYADMSSWPPRGEKYYEQKEKMVDTLITMAENVLPGLREHIVYKEGMTPRTIEHFTMSHRGIPYGWNFTPEQSDKLSLETGINGLYLAGSWAWPSHSVAMSQLSGYCAAQLIKKKEKID